MELSEKKTRVPDAFNRAARRYDLLCALNPGYSRHLHLSARRLELPRNAAVLDLCCGTGLSTRALRDTYPDARIVALDASSGMLDYARRKPELAGVELIEGDATDPAAAGATGPFDGILMAYGIRNVPDPDRCLHNVLELLKPGGRIAFHEYSVADSLFSKVVWNAVAGTIIIPFGILATRSAELFRYLRQSVNEFDGVAAFRDRLERAGFESVSVHEMDGWQRGIVHTFIARRPL